MEDLDGEFKEHLKHYTCLKWDDPRFWDKLRYALPHKHKLRRNDKGSKENGSNKNVGNQDVVLLTSQRCDSDT